MIAVRTGAWPTVFSLSKVEQPAIEVVTGSHRPEEYSLWQREALEFGFLASRGADYHGPGESPAEPGTLPQLSASLTPVWSKWAH